MNWQALSSIATFLAVLVALFLPSFRERKQLRLVIMRGRIDGTNAVKDPQGDFLIVTVTNRGETPITITHWSGRIKKALTAPGKRAIIDPESLAALPSKLQASGDYAVLYSKVQLEHIDEIERIEFHDSEGKTWKVPMRRFRRSETE